MWSAAATAGRISRARRSSTLSSPPSSQADDQIRFRLWVISRLSNGLPVSNVSYAATLAKLSVSVPIFGRTPLIQHGSHGQAEGPGAALVVECGQHFKQASAEVAIDVATNFIAHFGLVDRPVPRAATPPRRFELLRTHVVQHESFAFVRPLIGFETFAEGELIATDGPVEIRALCDDCTIFMPARKAIVGREGVYLTKPLR